MNPFSYFLTFLTMAACSCAEQLWWMIPSPPWRAMAMAILRKLDVK